VTAPTLDLAILATLEREPNHGFGIALQIQDSSGGLLIAEEGSLYPALHRLEKAGFLAAEWKPTDAGRRARWYRLTASGKRRLAETRAQWETLHKGLSRLLRYA